MDAIAVERGAGLVAVRTAQEHDRADRFVLDPGDRRAVARLVSPSRECHRLVLALGPSHKRLLVERVVLADQPFRRPVLYLQSCPLALANASAGGLGEAGPHVVCTAAHVDDVRSAGQRDDRPGRAVAEDLSVPRVRADLRAVQPASSEAVEDRGHGARVGARTDEPADPPTVPEALVAQRSSVSLLQTSLTAQALP